MLGGMDSPKRSLWEIIRRILGARIEGLPGSDMRGGINQLPESSWDQAYYDDRTKERVERDDA